MFPVEKNRHGHVPQAILASILEESSLVFVQVLLDERLAFLAAGKGHRVPAVEADADVLPPNGDKDLLIGIQNGGQEARDLVVGFHEGLYLPDIEKL
jgi:hypothetical protein